MSNNLNVPFAKKEAPTSQWCSQQGPPVLIATRNCCKPAKNTGRTHSPRETQKTPHKMDRNAGFSTSFWLVKHFNRGSVSSRSLHRWMGHHWRWSVWISGRLKALSDGTHVFSIDITITHSALVHHTLVSQINSRESWDGCMHLYTSFIHSLVPQCQRPRSQLSRERIRSTWEACVSTRRHPTPFQKL